MKRDKAKYMRQIHHSEPTLNWCDIIFNFAFHQRKNSGLMNGWLNKENCPRKSPETNEPHLDGITQKVAECFVLCRFHSNDYKLPAYFRLHLIFIAKQNFIIAFHYQPAARCFVPSCQKQFHVYSINSVVVAAAASSAKWVDEWNIKRLNK